MAPNCSFKALEPSLSKGQFRTRKSARYYVSPICLLQSQVDGRRAGVSHAGRDAAARDGHGDGALRHAGAALDEQRLPFPAEPDRDADPSAQVLPQRRPRRHRQGHRVRHRADAQDVLHGQGQDVPLQHDRECPFTAPVAKGIPPRIFVQHIVRIFCPIETLKTSCSVVCRRTAR